MDNGQFALKCVAAFFCLISAIAASDMALALARGSISLNVGILAFLVGIGLLRHRRASRFIALACAGLTTIGALVLGVVLLVGDQNVAYSGWGYAGTLPSSAGFSLAALGLVAGLWQLWVLTRPHVTQLFQPAAA